MNRIYLDNNATTPIDPLVLQAYITGLESGPLNPSSIHYWGQQARARVARVRRQIAELVGVRPTEIIFHSGATEGLNLCIRALIQEGKKKRVLTTQIEHAAVFETLRALDLIEPIYLPVGLEGAPDLKEIEMRLKEGADAIVLSSANSETGVLLDIESVGRLAQHWAVPFICDTTALMGKKAVQMFPGISAMSFSAHKFHGPVGIGFSVVRHAFVLPAQMTGGGQEEKRRSGTLSVALIEALGVAVQLAQSSNYRAIGVLRDRLEGALLQALPSLRVNGTGPRLCNTSNIVFPHMEGDALFMALDLAGLAVSLGSACASGSLEPSRVLLAMGLSREEALGSVRFSLSRMTTADEIERAIAICLRVAHLKVM